MCSWGRGHPEDISATMGALVEDKFDSDGHDKKRTAGQILWIRGLTRLQTQVGRTISISLLIRVISLFLLFFYTNKLYLIFKELV